MKKSPRHISFGEVRQIISDTPLETAAHPFASDELVVVHDSSFFFKNALELGEPYIIEDVRMLIVLDGEADVIVNLVRRHIGKGMIVLMGYGSIIQPEHVSGDLRVKGFMMKKALAERVLHNHMTSIHLDEDNTYIVQANEKSSSMLNSMLDMLWRIVMEHGFREDIAVPSLIVFSNYFISLLEGESKRSPSLSSHSGRLLGQFIQLVNQHCTREHTIAFYASRLCLSPHYLGLIVKAESGITAKEWIDRAVITQAKVMLKGYDLQVAEVSGRLSFQNPSFFSKYFKRLTGMTPQEYKRT